MRQRELMRLPVGKYDLTDSINNYQYSIEKKIREDGETSYFLINKSDRNSAYIQEKEINVFEDGSGGYKEKILIYHHIPLYTTTTLSPYIVSTYGRCAISAVVLRAKKRVTM